MQVVHSMLSRLNGSTATGSASKAVAQPLHKVCGTTTLARLLTQAGSPIVAHRMQCILVMITAVMPADDQPLMKQVTCLHA